MTQSQYYIFSGVVKCLRSYLQFDMVLEILNNKILALSLLCRGGQIKDWLAKCWPANATKPQMHWLKSEKH